MCGMVLIVLGFCFFPPCSAAAVKLLLDMGSDINAQIETNRNTALTLACFQGRHEVVSLLLERKANVEHRAKVSVERVKVSTFRTGEINQFRIIFLRRLDLHH